MKIIRQLCTQFLEKRGFVVLHESQHHSDLSDEFMQHWGAIRPFTMTSIERAFGLYQAVNYVLAQGLEGDLVECGVFRGGSSMLMARLLHEHLSGVNSRQDDQGQTEAPSLWLYDTFTGMPEPGPEDRIAYTGQALSERNSRGWWMATLEDVQSNMDSTGIDSSLINYVAGDILETLHHSAPDKIALLRLDTDWYASTKLELEILFPRLVPGGVLIIDDYGHFTGARQAVDEYFDGTHQLLHRLDYTGRLLVKG